MPLSKKDGLNDGIFAIFKAPETISTSLPSDEIWELVFFCFELSSLVFSTTLLSLTSLFSSFLDGLSISLSPLWAWSVIISSFVLRFFILITSGSLIPFISLPIFLLEGISGFLG